MSFQRERKSWIHLHPSSQYRESKSRRSSLLRITHSWNPSSTTRNRTRGTHLSGNDEEHVPQKLAAISWIHGQLYPSNGHVFSEPVSFPIERRTHLEHNVRAKPEGTSEPTTGSQSTLKQMCQENFSYKLLLATRNYPPSHQYLDRDQNPFSNADFSRRTYVQRPRF